MSINKQNTILCDHSTDLSSGFSKECYILLIYNKLRSLSLTQVVHFWCETFGVQRPNQRSTARLQSLSTRRKRSSRSTFERVKTIGRSSRRKFRKDDLASQRNQPRFIVSVYMIPNIIDFSLIICYIHNYVLNRLNYNIIFVA